MAVHDHDVITGVRLNRSTFNGCSRVATREAPRRTREGRVEVVVVPSDDRAVVAIGEADGVFWHTWPVFADLGVFRTRDEADAGSIILFRPVEGRVQRFAVTLGDYLAAGAISTVARDMKARMILRRSRHASLLFVLRVILVVRRRRGGVGGGRRRRCGAAAASFGLLPYF